jgi:hypothetical protein
MNADPRHVAPRRPGAARRALLAALATLASGLVQAQAQPPGNPIYTCTLADGRRMTSDRLIAACSGVEQRVLNRDGSLRQVIPPSLTADERARQEAQQRREAQQRQAQLDAVRRDRNLMSRFPDEAAHQRAREAALGPVLAALRSSEQRLEALQRERKPLEAESEFYVGRQLPEKLRQQLSANDAAADAQRHAIATHRAELDRINGNYDAELERLRKLWAGAPPGSLGTTASATVPVAADLRNGAAAPR